MINTIIQDLEGTGIQNEPSYAKNILKFNSELKKIGFKKAYLRGKTFSRDHIEEDLTIYFVPSFNGDSNYSERNSTRSGFISFYKNLMKERGAINCSWYYELNKDVIDTQKELKVKFEGKSYKIGDYIEERNIVLFYLPSGYGNWNVDKNTYIPKILEYLKIVVKENKIKEFDTSKLREKIFIQKFTDSLNFKIDEGTRNIGSYENSIESLKSSIADNYNHILTGKLTIESLEKIRENIKDSLLKKIEEIKGFKFVTDVNLTTDGITLKFEKIFIKVMGKDIDMGEYTITLMPNKMLIVSSSPLERIGNIYHSPHISNDRICFGKQKTIAHELLGKMELKKLTYFLFLYLKSYNPEDTYCSMNFWVERQEAEEKKKKEAEEKKKKEAEEKKKKEEKDKKKKEIVPPTEQEVNTNEAQRINEVVFGEGF